MSDKNDEDTHEIRSKRIKEGIERSRASGRKPGRPSIKDMKRKAKIGAEALELRQQGQSWTQIAKHFDCGKTTVRRLVKEEMEKIEPSPTSENNPSMPKPIVIDFSRTSVQSTDLPVQEDVLIKLPKSFQLFIYLLEKAKKAQEKGEGDLNFK